MKVEKHLLDMASRISKLLKGGKEEGITKGVHPYNKLEAVARHNRRLRNKYYMTY